MRRLEELKAGEVFKFGKFEWIKLADIGRRIREIQGAYTLYQRLVADTYARY